MPKPYFQFKQFTVWHDKCAMKVGTDGVLLGAWANVSHAFHILDVGTGTGLIALMLAQRNRQADITGIEIDEKAVSQARENIKTSPWKERINIFQGDYKQFTSDKKYDLIVSNPPYFADSLKSPENVRNMARHTDTLGYNDLIAKSASLLSSNGNFSIIIPADTKDIIKKIAFNHNLYLTKQTNIHTTPNALSKRTLLNFCFNESTCKINDLTIEQERHVYTHEYIELTKAYYLKM